MSAYTDQTAIENYLLTNIDSSFSSQIVEWITAVSTFIDNYTGRQFVADGSASARTFIGRYSQKLPVDDCVAVSTVEIGDRFGDNYSTVASTDYAVLPLNELPKNCIALKHQDWGVGIHRITAKWGYSVACPLDIKFVATVLAAGIVNTQAKTGAAKKSESIGNYSVSYVDDSGVADYERAMSILDRYVKLSI
jgi:hypothetical protein